MLLFRFNLTLKKKSDHEFSGQYYNWGILILFWGKFGQNNFYIENLESDLTI